MFLSLVLLGGATPADRKLHRLVEYNGDVVMNDSLTELGNGWLWFQNRLPRPPSGVLLDFSCDRSHSQLGFWFKEWFGGHGDCFGGPASFKGVAVLFDYNGSHVQMEVRESDGKEKFDATSFFPIYTRAPSGSDFAIACDFAEEALNVTFHFDGRSELVFHEKLRVALHRPWFGVTGHCERRVVLKRIEMHPQANKTLRTSPRVPADLSILSELKEKGARTDPVDVVSGVDALANLSRNLATTESLASTVANTMLQWTEGWQRRSLNLVRKTSEMRVQLEFEMNHTKDVIGELRFDVDRAFRKLKSNVHDLESELYFGVLKGYELERRIKKAKKEIVKDGLTKALIGLSVVETLLLIAYVGYGTIRQ